MKNNTNDGNISNIFLSPKIKSQHKQQAEILTQDDLVRFIENIQCNLEKID